MDKYEKKYREDVINSLDVPDKYEEIARQINFSSKERKGSVLMNKKLIAGMSVACVCLVCGGVGVGATILNQNKKDVVETKSMVKMDLNPSVSFVLDSNNKVVSVTGENDEGKMIIQGEAIVGKDVEDAIELVLKIENETGYLVSGNVSADKNNLNFTISCDDEKIKESIKKSIDKGTKDAAKKLQVKLDEKVAIVDGYAHSGLEELVCKLDPTITQEQAKAMSYDELIAVCNKYYEERKELYSEDLVNLYNQAKGYEIKFADTEFTKNLVSLLGEGYGSFLTSLDNLETQLKASIEVVNDAKVEYFISADSSYQVALEAFKKAKEDYLVYENKVASISENSILKPTLETALKGYKAALDIAEQSIISTKETAESIMDSYVEAINKICENIDNVKQELSSKEEYEALLTQKTQDYEQYMNKEKDEFFAKFEEKYKNEIELSKAKASEYKKLLIEKNNQVKSENK